MTFTPIGQTAQTQVVKNPSAVGGNAGETGSAIKRRDSSEIAKWLAGRSPAQVDKAAESRALSHGVNLAVRYEGRYPTDENGERRPSYQVAVGCDIHGSTVNRQKALVDLQRLQEPAPVREIERWLAELSVLTAGRGTDGISAELQVTAYSSRLAQYPADVSREALLGRSWKWFPSWAELEKVCESLAGPRRHMLQALSKPETKTVKRKPTQEERDRMAKYIAERFPNRSEEERTAALDEALKGECISEQVEV